MGTQTETCTWNVYFKGNTNEEYFEIADRMHHISNPENDQI